MCDHEYNPDSSAIASGMLRVAREQLRAQQAPVWVESPNRKAFENWYAKRHPGAVFQSTGDRYIPSEVTEVWKAWEAATESSGDPLDEYTIKQVAMRFGTISDNRIVFYDDKFTEFADALVVATRAIAATKEHP